MLIGMMQGFWKLKHNAKTENPKVMSSLFCLFLDSCARCFLGACLFRNPGSKKLQFALKEVLLKLQEVCLFSAHLVLWLIFLSTAQTLLHIYTSNIDVVIIKCKISLLFLCFHRDVIDLLLIWKPFEQTPRWKTIKYHKESWTNRNDSSDCRWAVRVS